MKNEFLVYNPYLTYSDPLRRSFVSCDGTHEMELDDDAYVLFELGKQAFKLLPACELVEDFNKWLPYYNEVMQTVQKTLSNLTTEGKLMLVSINGTSVDPYWENADDDVVLGSIWSNFSELSEKKGKDDSGYIEIRELFLLHVLIEIDNALISKSLDGRGLVSSAVSAASSLANVVAIDSESTIAAQARQKMARAGAQEKLARDPKQKEKLFVRGCWDGWQRDPNKYPTKAEFGRDMLSKCEHLTNNKIIEDWCREWERDSHPAS